MKERYIIKTIDGNRYETDVMPTRTGRDGIDWLAFPVREGVGTKYLNLSNVVSITELEVEE